MRMIASIARRLATYGVLLLLVLTVRVGAQDLPAGPQRDLVALAEHLHDAPGAVDYALASAGYEPSIPQSEYARWSTERKLAAAYLSAERAQTGGGERLLALLSADLARSDLSEAVEVHPRLGPLAKQGEGVVEVAFSGTPRPLSGNVRVPHLQAIGDLAEYLSSGAEGSYTDVAIHDFGVDRLEAVRLAIDAGDDPRVFLERVRAHVGEPQFAKGMTDIFARREARYGHASPPRPPTSGPRDPTRGGPRPPPGPMSPGGGGKALTPATARYQDYVTEAMGGGGPAGGPPRATPGSPRPPTPGGGGGGGVPGGGGGGSLSGGGGGAAGAAKYRAFQSQLRGGSSFRAMSRGSRGFGGVVFGSETRLVADSATIKRVHFAHEGDADQEGTFRVDLSDGRSLSYGPIPPHHAVAAYRMVFTTTRGVAAWNKGEGIGLVGVFDNTPLVVCDADARTLDTDASYFNAVVHPALQDNPLGLAALTVDTFPIAPQAHLNWAASQPDFDARDIASVRVLFGTMDQSPMAAGTWKVLDAPIDFRVSGAHLVAERRDETGVYDRALRRIGFLDMHLMTLVPVDAQGIPDAAKRQELETLSERLALRPDMDQEALADELGKLEGHNIAFERRHYRQLPSLLNVSWHHFELNRYAATLALLRLAKTQQATVDPPGAPYTRADVPAALAISPKNGLHPVPSFESGPLAARARQELDRCLAAVKRKDPELGAALTQVEGMLGQEGISGNLGTMLIQAALQATGDPNALFAAKLLQMRSALGSDTEPARTVDPTGNWQQFMDEAAGAEPFAGSAAGCGVAPPACGTTPAALLWPTSLLTVLMVRRKGQRPCPTR